VILRVFACLERDCNVAITFSVKAKDKLQYILEMVLREVSVVTVRVATPDTSLHCG
jgi:hypothetical protein